MKKFCALGTKIEKKKIVGTKKICSLGTKNERNFLVWIKTSDFILQERKQKLAIKIGIENIF
jgi:hypothetical protein